MQCDNTTKVLNQAPVLQKQRNEEEETDNSTLIFTVLAVVSVAVAIFAVIASIALSDPSLLEYTLYSGIAAVFFFWMLQPSAEQQGEGEAPSNTAQNINNRVRDQISRPLTPSSSLINSTSFKNLSNPPKGKQMNTNSTHGSGSFASNSSDTLTTRSEQQSANDRRSTKQFSNSSQSQFSYPTSSSTASFVTSFSSSPSSTSSSSSLYALPLKRSVQLNPSSNSNNITTQPLTIVYNQKSLELAPQRTCLLYTSEAETVYWTRTPRSM